jgi:hypothetical protein
MRYIHYNMHQYPLEATLQWRRTHVARPSDGKARSKLVTSTFIAMFGNVLFHDYPRQSTCHIPRCPYSWYVIQLHDRIVQVLKEFMLEAGATKGLDLGLEIRHIRSGASRDRHGDVVRLVFMDPHRHLVVEVTVTDSRTNINVPRVGARLPISGSLALGAQHGQLDADRCSASLR